MTVLVPVVLRTKIITESRQKCSNFNSLYKILYKLYTILSFLLSYRSAIYLRPSNVKRKPPGKRRGYLPEKRNLPENETENERGEETYPKNKLTLEKPCKTLANNYLLKMTLATIYLYLIFTKVTTCLYKNLANTYHYVMKTLVSEYGAHAQAHTLAATCPCMQTRAS